MIQLYPHQLQAIEWMKSIENNPRMHPDQPRGGILAHEMGLGKTLTALKFVEMQKDKPTLIVTPKSVILQWRKEAIEKTSLRSEEIAVYHGTVRQKSFQPSTRIVLTTFDIVRLESDDQQSPLSMKWQRIILDEAHRIAEASSKTSTAIRALQSPNRWAITGTPFRNCLSDIVALCKFIGVAPYHETTWWRANANKQSVIDKWRNTYMNIQLKNVLNMSPVVETEISLQKTSVYNRLERCIKDMHDQCSEVQENELLKILRTRQLCDHFALLFDRKFMKTLLRATTVEKGVCPLFPIEPATVQFPCEKRCWVSEQCRDQCTVCPKCCLRLSREAGMMPEGFCHSEKTKALRLFILQKLREDESSKFVIFSQWTSFLDVLSELFNHMNLKFERFDGGVNSIDERFRVIDTFQHQQNIPILLTSLGAGGEGITLTLANNVVLMEPYWNSSIEQQAIDRVHRIGQKRDVHVLRMVMEDTIELWVKKIKLAKKVELSVLLHGAQRQNKASINVSLSSGRIFSRRHDMFSNIPVELYLKMKQLAGKRKKRNLSMFVKIKKKKI